MMKFDIPSFIKPCGYYMFDHYKQLKDGECLLIIPNDLKYGKGYTTKVIKLENLK